MSSARVQVPFKVLVCKIRLNLYFFYIGKSLRKVSNFSKMPFSASGTVFIL